MACVPCIQGRLRKGVHLIDRVCVSCSVMFCSAGKSGGRSCHSHAVIVGSDTDGVRNVMQSVRRREARFLFGASLALLDEAVVVMVVVAVVSELIDSRKL
jgi:hypothetical protein